MIGRVKRVLLSVTAAALLAVVSGISYEQWSQRDVVDKHPPPGRMVEVGGHKLHLNCTGSGSPIVVLESGWGARGSLDFVLVQPEIAKSQRICSYDRAGIMWSERRDGTPSALQIAEDLHILLANAAEPGPYVMVGHSLGGLLIRVFAQQYPQDVVGMLFVEPSHPEHWERFASIEGNEPYEYPRWTRIKERSLIETGVTRMFGLLDINNLPSEAMIANDFLPYSFVGFTREELAWPQIFTEAAGASSFHDLPILVLTGEQSVAPATPEESADRDPEEVRIWNEEGRVTFEMREEIAALSTNSEHRVIEGSGHSMSNDVPDAVIRGVHDIVSKCCSDQPVSE